jgi:hypothetical protein
MLRGFAAGEPLNLIACAFLDLLALPAVAVHDANARLDQDAR